MRRASSNWAGMPELEGWAVVELEELAVDRIGNLGPSVSRRHAEEAG